MFYWLTQLSLPFFILQKYFEIYVSVFYFSNGHPLPYKIGLGIKNNCLRLFLIAIRKKYVCLIVYSVFKKSLIISSLFILMGFYLFILMSQNNYSYLLIIYLFNCKLSPNINIFLQILIYIICPLFSFQENIVVISAVYGGDEYL